MKLAYIPCLKASGKIQAWGEGGGREKQKEGEHGEADRLSHTSTPHVTKCDVCDFSITVLVTLQDQMTEQ